MADARLPRAELGRLALLRGLDEIERALEGHAIAVAVGRDVPPLDEVLRKAITHAHNLHRLAWA